MNALTSSTVNYWGIVPAAGTGLRMSSTLPKQYLKLVKLGEQTILETSLNKLLNHPKINKIVVALHAEDHYWSKLNLSQHPKILSTVGGSNRAESVLHALQCLIEFANESDWVLVHDAVRPFLRAADLDRLILQLSDHPYGGILGVPVRDTLKIVDNQSLITSTLPREAIWQAQTPQMFRFGPLYKALSNALQNGKTITDEASAMELAGHQLMMIEGDPTNIKITYPSDLSMMPQEVETCLE